MILTIKHRQACGHDRDDVNVYERGACLGEKDKMGGKAKNITFGRRRWIKFVMILLNITK